MVPGPLAAEQLARVLPVQTRKVEALLETFVALDQVHRIKEGCYRFAG